MSLLSTLARVTARPGVQRTFWAVLRAWSPAVVIGKRVFVSRYAAVTDVLARDQDFTLSEINGLRMQDMHLSFFLGMDRGPAHDRELALMEKVVKREDLAVIRNLVQAKAAQILQAARAAGQLDIVNDYGRAVPLSLIEGYFGIPVHDQVRMRYWMRILFHHLFQRGPGRFDVVGSHYAAGDKGAGRSTGHQVKQLTGASEPAGK